MDIHTQINTGLKIKENEKTCCAGSCPGVKIFWKLACVTKVLTTITRGCPVISPKPRLPTTTENATIQRDVTNPLAVQMGAEALCEDRDGCHVNLFRPNVIIITWWWSSSITVEVNMNLCWERIATDKLNPFNWPGLPKMSNELRTLPRFDFPLALWREEGRRQPLVIDITVDKWGGTGWKTKKQNRYRKQEQFLKKKNC